MAYTKELQHPCQYGSNLCKKRAVIAVYGWRNNLLGEYCRRHGEQRFAEIKLVEQREVVVS